MICVLSVRPGLDSSGAHKSLRKGGIGVFHAVAHHLTGQVKQRWSVFWPCRDEFCFPVIVHVKEYLRYVCAKFGQGC